MMKITSNVKGQIAVSKTELRALELGFLPSRPLFDARYDLIIDDFKHLKRVQIKYANGSPTHTTGAVVVKLDYENRQKQFMSYQETELDALIVYIPKVDKLCFIPNYLFVGKRKLQLRLEKSKNNQKRGVINAKDYYW